MKIHFIQFNDGKYGLRRRCAVLPFKWEYYSSNNIWWDDMEHIQENCKFETVDECKQLYMKILLLKTEKKRKTRILKDVKTIF